MCFYVSLILQSPESLFVFSMVLYYFNGYLVDLNLGFVMLLKWGGSMYNGANRLS